MPAIERTAYPRLKQSHFRQQDLQLYIPSREEIAWMKQHIIADLQLQLSFLVQLKTFQRLGYFVKVNTVPPVIVAQIQQVLGLDESIKPHYRNKETLKRHRTLIRNYMDVLPFDQEIEQQVEQIAFDAAQTINDPADIINLILEELIYLRYELPNFNKLDRKVCHIRHKVNKAIFATIKSKLVKAKKIKMLRNTLIKNDEEHVTPYQRFKVLPKNPTITHFKELIHHHNWLMTFGPISQCLQGISKIKLTQFAQEARSLDAPHLKCMTDINKKYTLMACLLAEAQHQAKDALALTLTRCIQNSDKAAQRHYESLDKDKDTIAYNLAEFLLTLTQSYKEKRTNKNAMLKLMDQHYQKHGGPDKIAEECEKIIAKHHKKHLPLVWQHYKNKRSAIFQCLKSLKLGGNTQSDSLLEAIEQAKNNYTRKTEWIDVDEQVDLSFASRDWRALIATKNGKSLNRHHFEVSVIDELSEKLKSGDIYAEGADAYGNYRRELLQWNECLPLLNDFCDTVNIADNKKRCVNELKNRLITLARQVDKQYPKLNELVIDEDGVPTLKKRKKPTTRQANRLLAAIKSRMPERKLLDILCLTHECSEWAHCFSPLSRSSSKLSDPLAANIVTAFSYGTRMGPSEAARHVRSGITARTIALVNKSHVNLKKLETALARVINYYKGFPLIKAWGTGDTCAVDGTLRNIYEQNLLAETHIRYGAKGGIAYHHISDNYVALFSSFISCGVWEAVAIIEGLLRNQSEIKPTKVHGDTQAQSAPVFGLAYLFGIRIMPRIRKWKELKFFRPSKDSQYKHIDSLFKDTINWKLIENNWQDMMQIVLSIHQGKVSSTLVLKRLGARSRKNQLYLGFRELGRVIRTLFLLEYISSVELRESITAETNKVEAFHNLSDWISFAYRVIIASNDVIEMEKAIRYNTLVTNLIILQNVIDMSRVIQQLREEGWLIKKEDLSKLSPYLTEHIKRFGDYILDLRLFNKDIDKIRAAAVVN